MQSQRRYDGIWDMVLGDIWDLFISFSMLADQMFQWLNVWLVICYQVPLTSKSPQILSCNKWVQKKERYWAEKTLKCSQRHPGSYKMMKPNTMTERMEGVLVLAQVKEPWERDLVSADIIIIIADTQSILAASDKIIKRTSLKLKTANSLYIYFIWFTRRRITPDNWVGIHSRTSVSSVRSEKPAKYLGE